MSNVQPAAKRLKTNAEDFKVSANDCITLHLVDPRKASSFPSPACIAYSFKPEFTHQLFGDDEEIIGYKGLTVDIFFSQTDYQALVDIKYSHKIHGATEIFPILQENFPAGITQDHQHFISSLSSGSDQQLPTQASAAAATPDLTHVVLANASEQVKALHARMQPLLLFFIDAASFIDADDPKWELFLAASPTAGQEVVGYCTLYTFYAYPDRKRYRLSQILVLPPFQRQGIAGALLKAVYKVAQQDNAIDVTFEDPTEALQSLREHVDLQRAFASRTLPDFAEEVSECWAESNSSAPGGDVAQQQAKAAQLGRQAVVQAQRQMHVTQVQARRLWEAVLYAQPKVRTDQGLATLAQQIRWRLEGNSATVKKQAEGKRVFNVPHHGFVMRKYSSKAPLKPENGMPVAMEGEEQSPEEAEQALAEAITARIAAIDAQLGKLGVLQLQ